MKVAYNMSPNICCYLNLKKIRYNLVLQAGLDKKHREKF